MQRRDGMIWAILGAVFLTPLILLVLKWPVVESLTPEKWTAIGGIALVIATIFLVFVTELTRRSAERVAKFQVRAAARLSRKQTYSLKWMKQQETKPYCDFVIVLNTSTTKAIGVYLKNLGHGPALKMRWKFTSRGKQIQETGREGLRKVVSQYPLNEWLEAYVPERVPASSEEMIFSLIKGAPARFTPPSVAEKARAEAIEWLRFMIRDMNIELEVHSIMGQKDTVVLHKPGESPVS